MVYSLMSHNACFATRLPTTARDNLYRYNLYTRACYTTSEVFQVRVVVEIDRGAILILNNACTVTRHPQVRRVGYACGDGGGARTRAQTGHARPCLDGWSITPRLRRPGVGGHDGERKGASRILDGERRRERKRGRERERGKGEEPTREFELPDGSPCSARSLARSLALYAFRLLLKSP